MLQFQNRQSNERSSSDLSVENCIMDSVNLIGTKEQANVSLHSANVSRATVR